MLNNNNIRELCYVTKIDNVKPIPGRDRVECAVVNGWTIMVRRDQFQPGDIAIYFEIDSKVPATEPFAFLESKHYKIKTQGYALKDENDNKIGKFYSQGLLMSAEDFGGMSYQDGDGAMCIHFDKDSYFKKNIDFRVGDFLTKELGVTYADPEDNKRKAKTNPDAKINSALARHPKIAKKYGKLIKRSKFLRAVFLFFFGRKKTVSDWPAGVPKTDEERIENCIWRLEDSTKEWVATEKIDGTSTTFYLKRGKGLAKPVYLVCSRNVVFDTPAKAARNYYEDSIGNVYLEMSEKYKVREALEKLLADRPSADWVAIQGETYGQGVQKRDYSIKDHDFRAFNLRFSDCGRLGTLEMRDMLNNVGIPVVPVISKGMVLPKTIDDLRAFVQSRPSVLDGKIKEGIVFRTLDGTESFKCVDPEFLAKYHQ